MNKNRKRQIEKEAALTAERLRGLLDYDRITGIFRHRIAGRGRVIGEIPGRLSGAGYVQIRVDGMLFYAHRIAWLYVTGAWPPSQVDHRDLNKTNNAFANLRLANKSQNQGNRPVNRRNKTGIKGVRWSRVVGKWQARITTNGKDRHLGYFESIEAVATAYAEAARTKFGAFARTGT